MLKSVIYSVVFLTSSVAYSFDSDEVKPFLSIEIINKTRYVADIYAKSYHGRVFGAQNVQPGQTVTIESDSFNGPFHLPFWAEISTPDGIETEHYEIWTSIGYVDQPIGGTFYLREKGSGNNFEIVHWRDI